MTVHNPHDKFFRESFGRASIKRLYYTDSYTTHFKANIIERVKQKGMVALVLDKTCFYPTSGGQPFDKGVINKAPVINVTLREADGAILHWIGAGEMWSNSVVCDIDWTRRFDHMQQHTGQHILSQAFLQTAAAETVSFHLSDASVTIDLHTADIQPDQIEYAEFLANQIIWQNRRVHIRAATLEEAQELPLRKIPPTRDGKLRLIEIEEFDLTACGGTHVAAAGEVGLIKIVKLERNGDQLRVEFKCGQRALQDYRQKHNVVAHLTAVLTTGLSEIGTAVTRLQTENKEAHRALKRQQNALARLETDKLLAQAKKIRGKKSRIVTRVYSDNECDPGQLRAYVSNLTKEDNVTALLGLAGEKSLLIFGRSQDAPGKMNQLIKPALQYLGSASGGGSAAMAQGGGPAADVNRVEQAVARAEKLLVGQL